jgi:hypothetical protein
MAFIIKCVYDFEQTKFGWTEVYFQKQDSVNLSLILPIARRLAEKRELLLGKEVTLPHITISVEGVAGQVAEIDATDDPWSGNVNFSAAAPGVSALLNYFTEDNRRRSKKYLRGIFDDLEVQGGKIVRTDATQNAFDVWTRSMTKFQGQLKADNWGWPAKDDTLTTTSPILSLDDGTDGYITITAKNPVFNLPAEQDKKINVRLAGLNDCPVLNGAQVVTVSSATVCKLAKKAAHFDWSAGGKITVNRFSFVQIATFDLVTQVVKRKTGRPKGVPLGKLRARKRG